MNKLRQKIIILVGGTVLFFGCFCLAQGQTMSIYNNTRRLMSNRAAMKKVVKRKAVKKKVVKKRRQAITKRRQILR